MSRIDHGRSACAAIVRAGLVGLAIGASQIGTAAAQTVPRTAQEPQERARTGPQRGQGVAERPRPEYDAIGVRLGGFFLYPSLGLAERYRDNIFYQDSDTTGDLVTILSPSLRLQSNWNVHSLTVYADADSGTYLDRSSENFLDMRAGAAGRLDIRRDLALSGEVSAARLHEPRSSPDQVGAAEPVTYRLLRAESTLAKRFNRLALRVTGGLDNYSYDNVPATGGGTFDSKDRNRTVFEQGVQLGYQVSPALEPFLRAGLNQRRYERTPDDNGFDRNSWGWSTVGGLAFDLGGITSGEGYLGYFEQRYARAGFGPIAGVSAGGSLLWNPTEITTVTLGADRIVEETTLSGAAGALRSALRAEVDHELRRNVILSANARYAVIDYEDITRVDNVAGASMGGSYLANEHLRLGVDYSYALRSSNAAGADYRTQTIMLRVTGQL